MKKPAKKPVRKAMGGMMPTQAAGGLGRAALKAPALPSQARGARPFKKGGKAKGC